MTAQRNIGMRVCAHLLANGVYVCVCVCDIFLYYVPEVKTRYNND